MAKAFGKFKRLIKKPATPKSSDKHVHDETSTPASTPTRDTSANIILPPAGGAGDSQSIKKTPTTPTTKHSNGRKDLASTDADDVLDGILQDLNIKGGHLAVGAERTDTVSEYSGGSAKSVESSSSSEGEDDDDDETYSEEESEADDEEADLGAKKNNRKRTSSVGDRVAAVVAAAEEIRKKRGASRSPPLLPGSARSSPVTEVGSAPPTPMERIAQAAVEEAAVSIKMSGEGAKSTVSKNSRKSMSNNSKEPSREGGSKASKASKEAKSKAGSSKKARSSNRPSMKSLRNSPINTFLPKNLPRPKARSTTPQFSPEIKPNKNVVDQATADPPPEIKSFDTKEDADDRTKDTQDVSEEDRTYMDDGDNTIGESTLDTMGQSTMGQSYEDERGGNPSMSDSQNENSTFDDEEEDESGGRIKTKKTVMNKDIIIHQPGQPSSLVVRAMYYTPLPASPEDIIIKVEASTVSFRDCLLRRGLGVEKISFPFVPGCEVVGTISNVGKDARHAGYRIGDRVVGMSRRGGGNGYYAKFNTRNVAPVISSSIDAVDAVCLVEVYMTAYQALRVGKVDGTPLTDANVLITDGFSPVGQAAVTLAKLEGANVYVTTTESRQDEYMKTLGVKCLPFAPSKWLHKIKGKMDIVIDNTCFDSYDSSWKALNPNGILVCTGMTSIYSFQQDEFGAGGCGGCEALGDMRDYQAKWAAIKARYMMSQTRFHDLWESFQNDPKKYQQELKYLFFLVENGSLKPKIAERVSIEEVPDAQRYLETGKANGTIVCLP